MSADENFLARWSQRKREIASKEQKPAPEAESEAPAPEEEPFDIAALPSISELTPGMDISLFLRKGVPEGLRNAALRRMWELDPAVRDYVGDALDYAWDWNVPGGVPGGGEIGAGVDVAKMVGDIFGDTPADENVIDPAAAQQETLTGVASPAHGNVPGDTTMPEVTVSQAQPELPGEKTGIGESSGVVVAVQRKGRHGGAAPRPQNLK